MTETKRVTTGGLLLVCLLALTVAATANDFAIESFSRNGEISWADTNTNGHYRVEWSSSLMTSNWLSDWSHLTQIPATGGVITAQIPMFYRVVHVPPQTFAGDIELRLVSGGAQLGGPSYDFFMSTYEITELQFVAFLNDAEANPGNERGANMYFDVSGNIYMDSNMTSSERLFDISASSLLYNRSLSPGSRYSTFPDRTTHPITGVTWYGAVKYCNWLTIETGRGEAERCFAEGVNPTNWHPANVTYAAWADGFDNAERLDLVMNRAGYRLPMDDYASVASYFNEYYKAAAWNGVANMLYGFGRDTYDGQDANYNASGDPYDGLTVQTTPTGYYDGSNHGGVFTTRANANQYGLYDLCGNVAEWSLDYKTSGSDPTYGILRGGSWIISTSYSTVLRTTYRDDASSRTPNSSSGGLRLYGTQPYMGFRIVTTSP